MFQEEIVEQFQKDPKLLEVQPFYHYLKNEIIEPEKIVVGTRYFWNKWAPILGPTLTVIIVKLRQYCYYNKLTKEKRDWCYPSLKTLAKEVGVSEDTVSRELNPKNPEKNDILKKFVRREPQYVYDASLRKKVRSVDKYYIAMDDPLTSEDEKILIIKSAERLIKQESKQSESKIMEKSESSSEYQINTLVVDNLSPNPQIADQVPSPKPQFAGANINRNLRVEEIHNTIHCLDTTTRTKFQNSPLTNNVVVFLEKSPFKNYINEKTLQKLVTKYGEEKVKEKIEILEWEYKDKKILNPGGLLNDALRIDYYPPQGFKTKEQREKEERERNDVELAEKIKEEREKERQELLIKKIQEIKNNLSKEELNILYKRAAEELRKTLPKLKRGEIYKHILNANVNIIIEEEYLKTRC